MLFDALILFWLSWKPERPGCLGIIVFRPLNIAHNEIYGSTGRLVRRLKEVETKGKTGNGLIANCPMLTVTYSIVFVCNK